MKNQWLRILIVGLTFGTAWAIRGQFGHEQGAAWAAGIGAMGLVLASGRTDWYRKIIPIALSSAIGWGAGGMISYGKVVGYGHSTDFMNTSYGLVMLFVIGGLFGLIGGGFVGLSLNSSEKNRVKWAQLITEMTAGGIIIYYFLVVQLEWLMTPPRSEAWAVCLGAGMAMLWHMVRNGYTAPVRVAVISAFGAGFGFAFGNFLQVVGTILEIRFNMWNVMEYSIGFFGGISMAYAVFTSAWPEDVPLPEIRENKAGLIILFAFLPFVVFVNSPLVDIFIKSSIEIKEPVTPFAAVFAVILLVSSLITASVILHKSYRQTRLKDALWLLILYLGSYIALSYSVTGAFKGILMLNHHLYVINFIVILILLRKGLPAYIETPVNEIKTIKWILTAAGILLVIFILAFILINIHGDMGGNTRFGSV
jgi:hypothetical protein